MNPKVDAYLERIKNWQKESEQLRKIVLSCHLEEEFKWGHPCYTYNNANVVLIHGFKEYCALLFMKGALLNDSEGILVQQTKNVQSARQIRFTDLKQITRSGATLKAYIHEAVEIEKAGLKVKFKEAEEFTVAEEFQKQLKKMPALKKAFSALTPGRQKAYHLYFTSAKQSATREARVEKYIPHILKGKGLNDD